MDIELFKFNAIPNNTNLGEQILECIGQQALIITYDFYKMETYISMPNNDNKQPILMSLSHVNGLEISKQAQRAKIFESSVEILSGYRSYSDEYSFFNDIFDQGFMDGRMCVVIIPVNGKELELSKNYIESQLGRFDVKETRNIGNIRSMLGSGSLHREVYKKSEERAIFLQMLESIKLSMTTNNLIYKFFIAFDSEHTRILDYIKNRMVVLSLKRHLKGIRDIETFFEMRALPLGSRDISKMISIQGPNKINFTLQTPMRAYDSGIDVGIVLNNGVMKTTHHAKINLPSFNLGVLITGLPGSGKTMEAMSILSQLGSEYNVPIFVLSPTDEWNRFAISSNMALFKMFNDENKINFFRCANGANRDRFYQDLATVLSSASDAGPFRRPMEKCMLKAFKNIYSMEPEPDPIAVFNAIEDAIIDNHGKRTSAGVKYTKHGENIKSALESLRVILKDFRYSSKEGVKFEDILKKGAVFDMSAAGLSVKPFVYALILNQLYSMATNFDTNGDASLRMLICVEEAQVIFKEETSPAVIDIKQRIQDFRKRGISLMLLSHNISDIESGIRRLCQIKFYMRQSPDLAYLASKELIFNQNDSEEVARKLKTLDSRVCAFSAVIKENGAQIQQATVFINTNDFKFNSLVELDSKDANTENPENFMLNLNVDVHEKAHGFKLKILYLSECIEVIDIGALKTAVISVMRGREHILQLVNQKNRILCEKKFSFFKNATITIIDGNLEIK